VRERRHLRPEEARKLIAAAGKRGHYPFRDKVLVRMLYRHGLRASEAVGMRWSAIDLDNGILHVERSKGGKVSTHSLDRDELGVTRRSVQNSTLSHPTTGTDAEPQAFQTPIASAGFRNRFLKA
jgi:integrase